MNFIYTIDPSVDEPIMLINKHIGFDENEGQGVDGSLFQEELLRLDTMGKKRIQVWINSPGGIVMDGYNIYNAILKSKTKVDTYVVGIAASIAAVIFQAGRKRVMADYSLLMYHNPYGGDSTELKKMRESIATMIAKRAGKNVEEVLKMMDRTTWIKADEALSTGFCDEVEASDLVNTKHGNAKAMWTAGLEVVNSFLKPKNKKMNKVANMLNLNSEASEEAIISEISAIQNKKMEAEEKLKKMESDYAEAREKCAKMEEEIKALKAKMEEEAEEKMKLEEEAKHEKAKNLIAGFAKSGKIKNEAVELWTKKAVEDFDGVKNLLESLPTNGKAASIQVSQVANEAELTGVAAKAMAEVRNKLKLN